MALWKHCGKWRNWITHNGGFLFLSQSFQLYSIIMLWCIEVFQYFCKMFSKSSAAGLLYDGKGWERLRVISHPGHFHCSLTLSHIQQIFSRRLKTSRQKHGKSPINEGITTEKSWKHCDKRKNCSYWAISFYHHNVFKSFLLQRRQKASICGKGEIISIFLILSD